MICSRGCWRAGRVAKFCRLLRDVPSSNRCASRDYSYTQTLAWLGPIDVQVHATTIGKVLRCGLITFFWSFPWTNQDCNILVYFSGLKVLRFNLWSCIQVYCYRTAYMQSTLMRTWQRLPLRSSPCGNNMLLHCLKLQLGAVRSYFTTTMKEMGELMVVQ